MKSQKPMLPNINRKSDLDRFFSFFEFEKNFLINRNNTIS